MSRPTPRLRTLIAVIAVAVGATAVLCAAGEDRVTRETFEAWVQAEGHGEAYAEFRTFLGSNGVGDVVPNWQLWRLGTDWREVGGTPFAVPPRERWAAMLPTLRLLDEVVEPAVGDVDVVSGWRTASFNRGAGGAAGSRHLHFEAVDVVPRRSWQRDALHTVLSDLWRKRGPRRRWGLGLYRYTRFHVDSHRHRRW